MQDSSVIIVNKGENLFEQWKLVLTGLIQNHQSKLVSPKATFHLFGMNNWIALLVIMIPYYLLKHFK